jgi:hypothetical protein
MLINTKGQWTSFHPSGVIFEESFGDMLERMVAIQTSNRFAGLNCYGVTHSY